MANGDIGIGKIIKQERGRDAIHVAVAPVEAAYDLVIGSDVCLLPDGKAGYGSGSIGIVDPFLKVAPKAGDKFYLFLYPGTITSLAHYWAHPAFEQMDPAKTLVTQDKAASETWLREYAARVKSYESPEEAYRNLIEGIKEGEVFYHGSDLHSFSELEDPDELKHHAQIVLGITISWDTFRFSCSC